MYTLFYDFCQISDLKLICTDDNHVEIKLVSQSIRHQVEATCALYLATIISRFDKHNAALATRNVPISEKIATIGNGSGRTRRVTVKGCAEHTI